MIAILTVVAVVLISMLINRFATIALTLTGMSPEEARFQARAAMSGVGLTTRSPEDIVAHPVRRRIVMWLMVVGSAGLVTAVASLIFSFRGGSADARLVRAAVLVGALLLLWLLLRVPIIDRGLSRAMAEVLARRGYGTSDWATLLKLSGDYAVAELQVGGDERLTERSLRQLQLRERGVVVMGIRRRGGAYVGAPGPDTVVHPLDMLIVYGEQARIRSLEEGGAPVVDNAIAGESIANGNSKTVVDTPDEAEGTVKVH
jgi:TrkA-C domain